jgi:hypothetical protein
MLFAGRKDITGLRWLTKTGVSVEKVPQLMLVAM